MSVPSDRPRLVFFVAEDWFFCSHFLDRALAARDGGFDVSVLTRVRSHSERIAASGLRLYPVEIGRRAANPVTELRALHEIWRIYRKEQPALVHHVALKPIVVGTIAAKLAGVGSIVNAPVGMGFVFTSNTFSARVLRPLLRTALRLFLNPRGSRVIFENPDDLEAAVAGGLVRRADHFDTITGHVKKILAAGWEDDGSGFVESSFRGLIARGLMISKSACVASGSRSSIG